MKDPYKILRKPLITEKSTALNALNNTVAFEVDRAANKEEIKRAIQQVFNVTVLKVNTSRAMGKTKRVGRHVGKRPDWKKAVVKLKKGEKIEFFEGT